MRSAFLGTTTPIASVPSTAPAMAAPTPAMSSVTTSSTATAPAMSSAPATKKKSAGWGLSVALGALAVAVTFGTGIGGVFLAQSANKASTNTASQASASRRPTLTVTGPSDRTENKTNWRVLFDGSQTPQDTKFTAISGTVVLSVPVDQTELPQKQAPMPPTAQGSNPTEVAWEYPDEDGEESMVLAKQGGVIVRWASKDVQELFNLESIRIEPMGATLSITFSTRVKKAQDAAVQTALHQKMPLIRVTSPVDRLADSQARLTKASVKGFLAGTLGTEVELLSAQDQNPGFGAAASSPYPSGNPYPTMAASPVSSPRPSQSASPYPSASSKPRSSTSPAPAGCYYQQVQCFRAEQCDPILICP